MKKEFFAALTLLLLFLGAAYNILHLNKLIQNMNSHLQTAEQACVINNFTFAESELSSALNLWLDADHYSHIFIRHSEIDAATDAYYEALSAVQEQSEAALSSIRKAEYHINSIYTMELISIKSIF